VLIPLARLPILILFFVSISLCLVAQNSHLGAFSLVVDHLPFLLFGAMIGPFANRLKVLNTWTPLFLSLFGFLLLGTLLELHWTEYKAVWLLCGLVGSLATIYLVQYFGNTIQRKLLAALGVSTLAIYLLHPYFQRIGAELVLRVAGPSIVLELIVPTAVGLIGPFLVWKLSQRHGLSWLFRLRLGNVAHQISWVMKGSHGAPIK
jgi:hypothetical protein